MNSLSDVSIASEWASIRLPLRIIQGSENVRAYVKIIVEGSGDQWKVWFKDAPQIAFGADWPSDAIQRLFEHFDKQNFDGYSIISVDDETIDGHLVFMVAMRDAVRIPVPSVN